jgi:hypothetical protein
MYHNYERTAQAPLVASLAQACTVKPRPDSEPVHAVVFEMDAEEQSIVEQYTTLAYAVRRAVAERKFRIVLRRPASISHLPDILKLRLFLSTDDKDYLDSVKCQTWLTLYKNVESFYQKLRRAHLECIAIAAKEREIDEYEKKLSHDIERAGGGGLVRSLGGPRAANHKLDETRSLLDAVRTELKKSRNEIERIQVSPT